MLSEGKGCNDWLNTIIDIVDTILEKNGFGLFYVQPIIAINNRERGQGDWLRDAQQINYQI